MEYAVFIITHTIMMCCMIVIIYVENTFSTAIGEDVRDELDTAGELITIESTDYDEVAIPKRVEDLTQVILSANHLI